MLSNETFWVIFKHCFVGFFIFYEHWYIQKHFLPQKFCALLSLIANALDIRPCSARRPSFFRCLFCVVVLTVILRMADFVNPSNNWMNGLSRADWQSKPAVRWICRISPWTSKIARSTLVVVSWHTQNTIHHTYYLLSLQLGIQKVMCSTGGLKAVGSILPRIWSCLNLTSFKLLQEMLLLL